MDLVARRELVVRGCVLSVLFIIAILVFILSIIIIVRYRSLAPRRAFQCIFQRVFRRGPTISKLSRAGTKGERKVATERVRVEGVVANDLV